MTLAYDKLDVVRLPSKLVNTQYFIAMSKYSKQRVMRDRKVGPPGTNWCARHKEFLPVDKFYVNPRRWNKLDYNCKDCRRSKYKQQRNKENE